MVKTGLLLALSVIMSFSLLAQQKLEGHWGKKYLDVAYAAAATNDGGYIMTGLTKNGVDDPYGDIVVIKIDAAADTTWTFTYGGPFLEGGNSVIQTADGGYMVSGHTQDFGAEDCDAFLMKLDKDGNHEWFKVYGGYADDISDAVIQLPDGGYAFAGITASYGNPPTDSETRHVYFVRTTPTGDTVWTKYYAGSRAEYMYAIAPLANGGFLSAGWTTSRGNGEYDGWLIALKGNGDTAWTRLYRDAGDCRLFSIIPTLDGGFMMAGFTTPSKTCRSQGLVVKLDGDGNELWRKTYGDTSSATLLHSIAQLPNGNFLCGGSSFSADTMGNVYMMTTDANGNKVADALDGGSGSWATSVAVQGNNGYLVAGMTTLYGDSWGDLYYLVVNNALSGVPGITLGLPRIFPNPVKDVSSVILPGAEEAQVTALEVMSVSGKVIYRQENVVAKDLVIYRDALPSGSYFFHATCKDGKEYKGKFVVQ